MWLCFGTAILSLAVHWHVMRTGQQFEQQASTKQSRKQSSQGGNFQALGASVPSGKSIQRQSTSQSSKTTKLHHPKSGTASKNVAITTEEYQINRLVSPEPKLNSTSFLPQSLLPQVSAQQQFFNSNKQTSDPNQVVVDLSDRRAYVYRQEVVIASYPIAVGKKGWETPTGSFQIMHKQHNPIWRHPITDKVFAAGPDSPLGDRWIGFWSDGHNEIGFHGTPDNSSMGTAISHGCLRMRNPDVRLLYQQVGVGTSVVVRE
ncbi:L,D-transpeptidase [Tolypothrix sp. FACHB-123]|uniref:L,D-transpeptidase n=1 Tax=Tolypothrix sp. FACHB-123 TaxID=2692868 RepID=UPI001F553964|nr:L,D-transpeptidase [Tolypothrix sp. FACHB-123]